MLSCSSEEPLIKETATKFNESSNINVEKFVDEDIQKNTAAPEDVTKEVSEEEAVKRIDLQMEDQRLDLQKEDNDKMISTPVVNSLLTIKKRSSPKVLQTNEASLKEVTKEVSGEKKAIKQIDRRILDQNQVTLKNCNHGKIAN